MKPSHGAKKPALQLQASSWWILISVSINTSTLLAWSLCIKPKMEWLSPIFATPLILNCATFGAFCPIIGHYCISPVVVAPLKRLGLCDIFRTLTRFLQESSRIAACICTSLHFCSPCSYFFSHILLYIFCLSKLLMNKWVLAQLVKASELKK